MKSNRLGCFFLHFPAFLVENHQIVFGGMKTKSLSLPPKIKLMRRLIPTLVGLLALVSFNAFSQTPVSGRVKDGNGSPIVSASVLQKGTSNGTTTDADGKFTIVVPSGAILEISAVGFELMEIEAQKASSVTLKATSSNLSEVIVTGVGAATTRKKVAIDVVLWP